MFLLDMRWIWWVMEHLKDFINFLAKFEFCNIIFHIPFESGYY